MTDGIVP